MIWKETYNFPIIVCAANRLSDGTMLVGARHWDSCMRSQMDAIGKKLLEECRLIEHEVQGFIDQFGNFYDRKQALDMVKYNGQKIDWERNGSTDELYSEGLY